MEGIPPARSSDNEDVVWALETAESLWKKNARVDAIVWLRRAAQEAAEAGDDDRASSLMIEAAALTENLTRTSSHPRASQPVTSPPPGDDGDDIDSLLEGESHADAAADLASNADLDELLGAVPVALPPREGGDEDEEEAVLLDDDDLLRASITSPPPRPSEAPPTPAVLFDAEPVTAARVNPALAATYDSLPPGIQLMGPGALSPLDLAAVPALKDAPPGECDHLVSAAAVVLCAAGTTLPRFGLAVVLEGAMVARLDERGPFVAALGERSMACLHRRRGSPAELRFEVTSDDTTVALWDPASLASALVHAPAIDAALAAEEDRLLAWSSLAASALASRLHEDVRARLFDRLVPRVIAPTGEVVAGGQPVPGLLLVAQGSVVVDGAPAPLEAGAFVFPEATFSAGRARATARGGPRGAILLAADRRTTQELCATEPLLLEILASS